MPAQHRAGDAEAGGPSEHLRAPAKLTRSLRVVGRRSDGYHLLESEMLAVDLADELEIRPPAAASSLEVVDAVRWRGGEAVGERCADAGAPAVPLGADNLVLRALRLAGRAARVRLLKRIPPGAGLGGGSSDAAAVLRWAGVLEPETALRLGADVPFCVAGGRAMVRGVGELVEPLPPEPAAFLLCTPPGGVSTGLAYEAFDELGAGEPDPARHNDLELAALTVRPGLARWRDVLAEVSGQRPQLAGSGSTWFVELAVAAAAGAAAAGAAAAGAAAAGVGLVEELAEALSAAGARAAISLARAEGVPG